MLGKKKLTEEKLCNILVNHTIEACEAVFPEIAEYVSDCPYFEQKPDFDQRGDDQFLLAVITCNLARLPLAFEAGKDKRVAQSLLNKFAQSFGMDTMDLAREIKSCKSDMKRLNIPSKNIVYGLPRVIFQRYDLNNFQEPYFRGMKSPNPLFLKEMNGLVEPLVWDLEFMKEEFKITI